MILCWVCRRPYDDSILPTKIDLKNKRASFNDFSLDCHSGTLYKDGELQKIEPLSVQFLMLLIAANGEVVSKQEVVDWLWKDGSASDETLRAMVKKTREVLGDNARNPSFIRTVPKQGYAFLPDVSIEDLVVSKKQALDIQRFIIPGLFVTFMLLLILLWILLPGGNKNSGASVHLTEHEIAFSKDDDVSTYYIDGALNIVGLSKKAIDNKSELTFLSHPENTLKTAVFDTINIDQYFISSERNKVLVMRNTNQAVVLDFAIDAERSNYEVMDLVWLEQNTVLAFVGSAGNVVTLNAENKSLQLRALNNGELVTSPALDYVNKYRSEAPQIEHSASNKRPNVYFSPNGGNVVVVTHGYLSSQLFVFNDLQAENPLFQQKFDAGVGDLVWSQKGERLSFISESLGLLTFDIVNLQLHAWNIGNHRLGRLIGDCNDDCFVFASDHNLPTLVTLPISFEQQDTVQVLQQENSQQAQYSPIYVDGELYFLSEKENVTKLMLQTQSSPERELFEFPKHTKISQLRISPNRQYITGLANQRVFLLDMQQMDFSYLPINFPNVENVRFIDNEQLSFYVATVTSSSTTANKQVQSGNNYSYNIGSEQIVTQALPVRFVQDVNLIANINGRNVSQAAKFVIPANYQASVNIGEEPPITLPNNLNLRCEACWQIEGNHLYSLAFDENGELSLFSKVNLLNGEQQTTKLLANNLSGEFAYDPEANQLVLVSLQNKPTAITEVRGMQASY